MRYALRQRVDLAESRRYLVLREYEKENEDFPTRKGPFIHGSHPRIVVEKPRGDNCASSAHRAWERASQVTALSPGRCKRHASIVYKTVYYSDTYRVHCTCVLQEYNLSVAKPFAFHSPCRVFFFHSSSVFALLLEMSFRDMYWNVYFVYTMPHPQHTVLISIGPEANHSRLKICTTRLIHPFFLSLSRLPLNVYESILYFDVLNFWGFSWASCRPLIYNE